MTLKILRILKSEPFQAFIEFNFKSLPRKFWCHLIIQELIKSVSLKSVDKNILARIYNRFVGKSVSDYVTSNISYENHRKILDFCRTHKVTISALIQEGPLILLNEKNSLLENNNP